MIIKRNGKYCLMTRDGSRTLGCHPTREKAVAQEGAVKASNTFTGKDGRESAALRGYGYAWRKTRDAFLLKHPKCNYPGCKARATEAEHISSKPARLGGSDAWRSLQPRCKPHHSKKTAAVDGGFGNPKKDRETKAAMEFHGTHAQGSHGRKGRGRRGGGPGGKKADERPDGSKDTVLNGVKAKFDDVVAGRSRSSEIDAGDLAARENINKASATKHLKTLEKEGLVSGITQKVEFGKTPKGGRLFGKMRFYNLTNKGHDFFDKPKGTEDDMSQVYTDGDAARPVHAFLKKMKDLLKSKVSDNDFRQAIKTARAHAGGKAIKKKKEAPEDGEKIAAGEWTELWLNAAEVRNFCESCADKMETEGMTEVLVFGEDEDEEPAPMLASIIDVFEKELEDKGEDAVAATTFVEQPGHVEFIESRVGTIGKRSNSPRAFAAWFHRKLLGAWPGEDPEVFFDDSGLSGYPSPKLEKTDKRAAYKKTGPERCVECRFFLAPQGCRMVEGTIDKEYFCKLWTMRPAMFDELLEDDDADLDAMIEAVSGELESNTFGKVPPAFLKFIKKKKGKGGDDEDDDDDDDGKGKGKGKKKKLPPFLAKKLGRKAAELYDFNEFRGEFEHRSNWRLFLELGDDPEWIPYLPKPGNYKHPKYGAIAVTRTRNERFVSNFADKVYQETIPIDAEHSPKTSGAMGWIVGMKTNENGSADAKVKWTDRGRDMLEKDRFRYFSPEWYNVWEDPSTGKKHFDVAIGGALTTRPFFKEGALRSLVACEDGIYSPVRGTFFHKESVMSKDPKNAKGEGGENDPQTFEELVESNRQLTERIEAQATDLKQATEKTAKLEADAQRKTITDIVMGKDEKVGGSRWFGESEKNVSLLEKMADKFGGLESEECKQYIEQQQAYAAQLAESVLLTTIGSDNQGDPASKGAAQEFNTLADKRLAEKVKAGVEGYTLGDAMSEIAAEQPALHQRYTEEAQIKV